METLLYPIRREPITSRNIESDIIARLIPYHCLASELVTANPRGW